METFTFTEKELHIRDLETKAQAFTIIGLMYKSTGTASVPVSTLGQLALDCLAKVDELKADNGN